MNKDNNKRIRILLFTVAFLSLAMPVSAQRRQIGDARTILKSGKNYDKAEKMMTDLLKDSANQDNPRIYQVWFQAVEKQYEDINTKMYMKQKVDTARFFDLAHRMFCIAVQLDSIDMRPDKKGRVDPQYRSANARQLVSHRPNLFFGGAFHLRKTDFQKAYNFFEQYIDCARQPLFEEQNLMATDERMSEAAYWATYCGYRMEDPVLTLRYQALARQDSTKLENTLQFVAEAWRRLNDDSRYGEALCEGFRAFPLSPYFFPRLMDSYTRHGNYEQALTIVDQALEADSVNTLFLFAKANVLLNLERFAESITVSERLIAIDPSVIDAYYNVGSAYLNIALRMDARRQKKQIKKMYQMARPYMERYRELAPNDKDKWAPALYRIYFNLNMGKQFDEIDKILKN